MTDKKIGNIADQWNSTPLPDMHDRLDRFIYAIPVGMAMNDAGTLDDETLMGWYVSAHTQQALFYYRDLEADKVILEVASPPALARYWNAAEESDMSRLRCVYVDTIKFKRVNGFSEQDWAMLGDRPFRTAFELRNPYEEWFLLTLQDSRQQPEAWMQIPYRKGAEGISYMWKPSLKMDG